MAMVMTLGMATACGANSAETTAAETTAVETTAAETTEAETTVVETIEETTVEETTEAETEDEKEDPLADSKLAEMINALYEKHPEELYLDRNAIDLTDEYMVSSFIGLDTEMADKLSEAVVSEPMMSSQAYSLVMVRVKDAADTAAVAEAMKNGINPRKWICVEADDVRVAASEDVILLYMVSTDLDVATGEQMVENFKEIVGGELIADLK